MDTTDNKKKLTIIQFDSELYYCSVVDMILFNAGAELTKRAVNMRQAEELIQKIEKGEIKPDIAIIDSIIQNNHDEGAQIASRIKKHSPDTKIIAYDITEDDHPWADYVAIKSSLNPNKTIAQGLGELMGINLTGERDLV